MNTIKCAMPRRTLRLASYARARARLQARPDDGMSTTEYAVGTIAAAGLATVLYRVVTSEAVADSLRGLVERALDAQL